MLRTCFLQQLAGELPRVHVIRHCINDVTVVLCARVVSGRVIRLLGRWLYSWLAKCALFFGSLRCFFVVRCTLL